MYADRYFTLTSASNYHTARDDYRHRPRSDRRDEYDDRRSPIRSSGRDRDGGRDRPAPPPAKIRVDNLHYDLTEEDLYDLFGRIAPVKELRLTYDRAGRSDGTAFVTLDRIADAREAVRQFDGANAIARAWEAYQRGEIAVTGVMIHYVISEVDRGEPIVTQEIECRGCETESELEEKIHTVEWKLIVQGTGTALKRLSAGDANS